MTAFDSNGDATVLRRQAEYKTELLNAVAHELSTPLTPLHLNVHYLRENATGLDAAQKRRLEALDRSVTRLKSLVNDITEVARLESDRFPIRLAPMDASDLIREAVSDYEDVARDASLDLRVNVVPGLVCTADADRIIQVMYNLLRNAIRFTPAGGRITVTGERRGPWAEFRVEDTGTGFARSDAKRLFQPFSQLGNPVAEAFRGAGLGLYISRGIIELHGGEIWGRSHGMGKGAVFGFRLPSTDSATVRANTIQQRRREATFAARVRRLV